jgi:hypothetical protein
MTIEAGRKYLLFALLVGLIAIIGLQHSALTQARTAIRALEAQLQKGVVEQEAPVQPAFQEASDSRPQKEELLRLRNEVGQLRERTQEMERLRRDNDDLREAILAQRASTQAGWSNLVSGARTNGINSASLSLLIQALTNAAPGIRIESTKALRQIGLQKLLETNRTAEADAELRASARAAIPGLIESLKDPDTFVRANAAITLGFLREDPHAVVPALVQTLQDPEGRVARSAAKALGRMQTDATAAIPNLLQAAQSPDPQMRTVALDALRQIDPEALARAGLK